MSLKPRPFGEVPEMTARVARATFRKGTLCLRIRDELGAVFTDEQFAGLFGRRGRPGWSPAGLVWVSVLQFAEGLTDRQAAEAVRSRIDWKYLLGLELDDPGFDHTVLSEFRDRLIAAEEQRLLLDTLLARLVEAGLLKPGGKARTDSTHVLAAVRVLNRVENVFTTLQTVLEQLAGTVPDWLGSWLPLDWQRLYGKPLKMPKTDTGRAELGARIGADGHRLWAAITSPDAPPQLVELPAVQVLRQVWVQQYWVGDQGRVRWRSKDDGQPPASIRIDSPFDIQARRGVKRGMGWTGYKDHYTETCGDPDSPNVIIDAETTLGPVHDSLALPGIHDRLAVRDLIPAEHLVDSAYADPEAILTARQQHRITLTTPLQADSSWQATAGNGFDQASFTIDWDHQQLTCPTGATSRSWRQRQDSVGPRIHVAFSNTDCRPCPSRHLCIRDTSTRTRPRQLTLHTQTEHDILHANRHNQTTQEWKARYATRAGVEGTMSQAVAHGARHARYTGLAKQHLQTILTAIGLNLIRIDAWLTGTPHATTRTPRIARLPLTAA
jgi:transposase